MSEWMNRWVMMWAMVAALLLPGMAHAVGYGDVLLGELRADISGRYVLKPAGKDLFVEYFDAYKTSIIDAGGNEQPVTLVFDEDDRLNAIYMHNASATLKELYGGIRSKLPTILNLYFNDGSEAVLLDGADGRILLSQPAGRALFCLIATEKYTAEVFLVVLMSEHTKFHKH